MKVNKQTTIGSLAHCLSQLLLKTLRVKVGHAPTVDLQQQYVYGFWHNKHLVPIMVMRRLSSRKYAGLVSTSKDGEILARWLKCLGYMVVRGSSSRKATSSLVKLIAALKDGYCVGIAADGPRGPRYEAKAGISFLAAKAGLQMVPIGVAYARKWQFDKSWDHYQIPKPFANVALYFGEPLSFTDLSDVAAVNKQVAQAINAADHQAELILQGKPSSIQELIQI